MDNSFAIESEDIGKRLDIFLSEKISNKSRSFIQKLIAENFVSVNKKPVKSNYRLRAGDSLLVEIPEPREMELQEEDIPLNIIYEDNDIIVINKPQDMVVHPAPGHARGTLVNALLNHCKDSLSGINGVLRPGIVHRIDKDTSGILVAAKNDEAHNSLAEQLKEHSMARKYYAVVCGSLKVDEGIIDKPVGRNPKDRKKMAVNYDNGKNAITTFRVLKRFSGYTMIEAVLKTGRTHQIRVHMSSIGHPLLGDKIYGSQKQPFALEGQVLHAKVLGFLHPKTNEYMEFETELPDYFKETLEKLRCMSPNTNSF